MFQDPIIHTFCYIEQSVQGGGGSESPLHPILGNFSLPWIGLNKFISYFIYFSYIYIYIYFPRKSFNLFTKHYPRKLNLELVCLLLKIYRCNAIWNGAKRFQACLNCPVSFRLFFYFIHVHKLMKGYLLCFVVFYLLR